MNDDDDVDDIVMMMYEGTTHVPCTVQFSFHLPGI